jgi:hypothetical protein
VVLLPVVIVAVGVASYTSSRRFRAQRTLLDRQAVRGRRRTARRCVRSSWSAKCSTRSTSESSAFPRRVRSCSRTMRSSASAASPDSFLAAAATRRHRREAGAARPQQHPLVRLQRHESFDDVVLWFALADGRRRAFAFAGRHLTDHNGAPGRSGADRPRHHGGAGRPAGATTWSHRSRTSFAPR